MTFESLGKIVVLHIPKTAGSSLTSVIFNNEPAYALYPRHLVYPQQRPLINRSADYLNSFMMFSGHYYLDDIERWIPGRKALITFLRDPRRRLLSHYYFLRHLGRTEPDSGNLLARKVADHDLLGFLRDDDPELVAGVTDNLMARHLTGPACWNDDGLFHAEAPEVARIATERLRGFFMVGFQERMDQDLDRLYARLGRPRPSHTPEIHARHRLGATGEGDRTDRLSPEIEAEIERRTRIDRMIYDFAQTAFSGTAADHAP